jgi:hypothetical protein
VELSEPDQGRDPVEVLGVLWSQPQVEACLAGWSGGERCGVVRQGPASGVGRGWRGVGGADRRRGDERSPGFGAERRSAAFPRRTWAQEEVDRSSRLPSRSIGSWPSLNPCGSWGVICRRSPPALRWSALSPRRIENL